MKKIIQLTTLVVLTAFVATGCGSAKPKTRPVANLTNQTVVMKAKTPFKEGSYIKNAIRNECTLGSQVATYTKKYASKKKVNVVFNNSATQKDSHYYLDLVIANAISEGNAFIGHNKSTQVQGTLYKDGVKLASFNAQRTSHGGFAGGYRSSCSILGSTADALGKDIALWLKAPTPNAFIGD